MTSALKGGGVSPKSRRKEQNQLICDSDKGVVKSENFANVIYGSPQVAIQFIYSLVKYFGTFIHLFMFIQECFIMSSLACVVDFPR